jgi:hypothetical protein
MGLGEKEIIKVLELAKYDELQNLQWKVEYHRVDIKELYRFGHSHNKETKKGLEKQFLLSSIV